VQGPCFEASRSLGWAIGAVFWRVALPIALPSIGSRLWALSAMEVSSMTLVRCACWEFDALKPVFRIVAVDGDPGGRGPALADRLAIVLFAGVAERTLVAAVGSWNWRKAAAPGTFWETGGLAWP